ncbi:MAG: alpha/beta hydrolase family protein [Candidatus Acidiferrum sp.]
MATPSIVTPFVELTGEPGIRGFLHEPGLGRSSTGFGDAVVLTHGAGADCQSRLLVEMSDALAACGFTVLRFDLPFRQLRRHGPPAFGSAARDRDGLRRAAGIMRKKMEGRVFLGGHSYGGRQATMLVAEEPEIADRLLLLSYPLHPPKKPAELRTGHFPKLSTPAFFVHGTRDPFGTIAEMKAALKLIPGAHALVEVEGAGHDLVGKKTGAEWPARIANEFETFLK